MTPTRIVHAAVSLAVALAVATAIAPASVTARGDDGPGGGATKTGEDAATDADALIEKARAALREGGAQEAVRLLQQAIAAIQEAHARGLVAFCPAAPDGWKAHEARSTSGSHGAGDSAFQWTQVDRRYEREGEGERGARASISLTTSPQLLAATRAAAKLFENEQMLKMMSKDGKTYEKLDREGLRGWIQLEKSRAQLTAIGDSIMVQLTIEGTSERATLDAFADGIDWKGLRAADESATKAGAAKK